ncbi:hypothetical protein Nepgr_031419 [Nepenthes gracilis]|uniref:mitogen-activated protein kinase kinase kinase n=1 Tax=Nepenthes gracilis TaxID=150966 RepID=A0AAD3TI33_NEPGR|nr:hypothetical protein Nepgr_031419 [Nepenthes gracilis]
MPSWWGKSSSKEAKKKSGTESFIDSLQRKFKSPSDAKFDSSSGASRRHCSDVVSERGSQSRAESRSSSPSKHVARCQSFAERPHAQPLPLPAVHPANVRRTDSGINVSAKPRAEKSSKSLFLPLPRPACIRSRPDPTELDVDLVTASVYSESSIDSDDDTRRQSPQASDCDNVVRTTTVCPSSMMLKDQASKVMQTNPGEAQRPVNTLLSSQNSPASPKRRPLGNHVASLQVPHHGAFFSAPDSSMSSPSRSPMRAFGNEQVMNTAFWAGKPYPDVNLLGSGQCSSPGSGQNSGHNSMGGDLSGQLFWQPSRGSPEYSPLPSPRMASPGPGSRVQSGAVTPIHPRAGGAGSETHASWADDGKQQSHRLPLPPITIPHSSPFSHGNSAATSPSVPRSPARTENPTSPGSRWKKGKLLGRGTFGHVYAGFNSETGEMCAMKEVTLFSDDAKSRESAKQLGQEIALLSRLRHPNIVQYYGSETVNDKLYIYLEYVSGGSIYKILQEYGKLGEAAIRSYTQQILSGLAYLHAQKTVHRDIKGANILVDPYGRVKLADFGMAKHITGQSCPLSFKGSPYWMAPEVIKTSNGCNLAVDIWSLGCTVLEMATTKPPWSQYEGVAAMFKIGNSKELPAIPDHLSEEGKEFVKLCLQRNPHNRPAAAQLLEHPFVKNAAALERPIPGPDLAPPVGVTNGIKTLDVGLERKISSEDSERLAVHSSRVSPTRPRSSEYYIPRNISCPVSPIGSPLAYLRSPQLQNGVMSPSPISSPRTTSGSSTPLTGGGSGSGTIPSHHSQHLAHFQDGFGSIPRSPKSVFLNGPTYHDPNLHIFRAPQPGSHGFRDLVSSENETATKQLGRPWHVDLYNGQSVLADRVSQQLLRDHVKLNPSVD